MFRLILLLPVLAGACADSGAEAPPAFEGSLPNSAAMQVVEARPWLTVEVGGGPQQKFLLDTGALMTAQATSGAVGVRRRSLKVFGLNFAGVEIADLDLFSGGSPCDAGTPAGLLGGDILRWFRVILNYQGKLATIQSTGGVGIKAPEVTVAMTLAGGGAALLPGGGGVEVNLHDALPLLSGGTAKVEGRDVTALLDTGATFNLINPSLLKELPQGGRPRACCWRVELAGRKTALQAHLTRLKQLGVGDVKLASVPALELDDARFWSDLAATTGREVGLILGGSFFRLFKVDMDFPARTLRLATQPDSSASTEFFTPGFSFCRAANADALVVLDVFSGSEAAKQGIKPGDRVLSVEGKPVGSRSASEVRLELEKLAVGAQVKMTFKGGVTKNVRMEQLLPQYK